MDQTNLWLDTVGLFMLNNALCSTEDPDEVCSCRPSEALPPPCPFLAREDASLGPGTVKMMVVLNQKVTVSSPR